MIAFFANVDQSSLVNMYFTFSRGIIASVLYTSSSSFSLCAGDISKVLERLPADAKVIFVDDVVGVINIRGGEKECFLQK